MNACRNEKDDYTQRGLFWKLSAYLSLVTWKKMHRRLTNWTSRGFIYAITYVPLNILQSKAAGWRGSPNLSKSNKALFEEIKILHDERGVEQLMDHLASIQFEGSHLKPNDLKGLRDELAKENAEDSNSTRSAYNEASSIPFQCFVIALLIGLVKALSELDEIRKAEGKARQEMHSKKDKRKANQGGAAKSKDENVRLQGIQVRIWEYSRILWTVFSSRMFDDHLQLLQGLLAAVVPGQMDLYTEFFRRLEGVWLDRPVGVSSRRDKERYGGGEDEEEREGEGNKEDVEEEQRRRMAFIPATSDTEPVIQFKRWTSMITSYFTDLRVVTKAAKTRPHSFGSKILITKRCSNGQSLDWRAVIRSFCCQDKDARPLQTITSSSDPIRATDDSGVQPSSSEDYEFTADQAENTINLLQRYIDLNRKTLAAFGSEAPSVDTSKSKSNKINKVPGTVFWTGKEHCESIVASLFRYLDDATPKGPEDVRELISVRTSFGF